MTLLCSEIYNYVNDFNSVDIYGNNLLNRSSAAHGTDVVYLLGPTMYKNFFNSDFQSFSETRHGVKFKWSVYLKYCTHANALQPTLDYKDYK